jgi:Fe-S-cluster containining protein
MAQRTSRSRPSRTSRPSAAQKTVTYDCVTCGACCYNPDDNREIGYIDYVEIKPTDPIMKKPDLVRRLVVLDNDLLPHMRLNHLHRCAALTGQLGVNVGCSIYHDRPTLCRAFSAGSKKCKELRKERGVDA